MSERYDRQIRLWGTVNQLIIEESEIFLIGDASIILLDSLIKCLLLTGFPSIKSDNSKVNVSLEKYCHLLQGIKKTPKRIITFSIQHQEEEESLLREKMKGSSIANGIILSILSKFP